MAELRCLPNVVTLILDTEKCVACGMCAEVCPHGVFLVDDDGAAIVDRDACMECGACALNCPVDAVSVRAGVGCAAGLISAAMKGTASAACCCNGQGSSCCP